MAFSFQSFKEQIINFCHSTINALWGSILHRNLRTTGFWSKGENHYFQIHPQPYLRTLKRQHVWAQHVFRTRASWNVGIPSASLRYWIHYKKSKTRQWCVHARREGIGVPRERHKTHGQRKKVSSYTFQTTRKEVRQCHPVRLIPLAQKEKDQAYILWGVLSLMYDFKPIYLF